MPQCIYHIIMSINVIIESYAMLLYRKQRQWQRLSKMEMRELTGLWGNGAGSFTRVGFHTHT